MASDGRKSLMISKEAHTHLTQMANSFDVSQPELVEAMLKSIDKTRLAASLQEVVEQRKLTAAEANQKRALLERALSEMTVAQVAALLSAVK